MSNVKVAPDLEIAQRFLDILDPNGKFTFQTFDDDQDRKDGRLARVFNGTLEEHAAALRDLQKQGAGVFVTINETDLNGRKEQNVVRVRAVFVDLDGAPVGPVLEHQCEPHMVIESSEEHWHAYWLSELPLGQFRGMQKNLAQVFNGDSAVCDLPRVMRLPGFFHHKVKNGLTNGPFMTRIESMYPEFTPYSCDTLIKYFPEPDVEVEDHSHEASSSQNYRDADLYEALSFIDPVDREDWVKIGHAMKAEDPNLLHLFLEWSRGEITGARPATYTNDKDVIAAWNSFKPDRIGISAMFAMAQNNGYRRSSQQKVLRLGTQIEVLHLILRALTAEHSVEPVFTEGRFWTYNGLHWTEYPEDQVRVRVHEFDGSSLGGKKVLRVSKAFTDGVVRELAAAISKPKFFDQCAVGVNMKNGFVCLDHNGETRLTPHAAEHKQRFMLNHDYIGSMTEIPDGLFKTLMEGSLGANNFELHTLVLEIIGAALSGLNTRLKSPKAFVLHGASAANGKSSIQALIKALLPPFAVSSVPPADLGDPQFLAMLVGKQINISDELSNSKAIASDRFKACVTGDDMSAKVVYHPPFTFSPKALHIFAANQLPVFSGGVDNGIERRIVVLPFDRTIPEEERIPDIGDKIAQNEGHIVIALAIRAAEELLKNGVYTIPQSCNAATQQWFRDVDPVSEWLEDNGLERYVTTAGITIRELYSKFNSEMRELGIYHIPSARRFKQRLRSEVDQEEKWVIVRRNVGDMIFPKDLFNSVSKVTKFP